jgi:RND family efflux transporter MFP subunit
MSKQSVLAVLIAAIAPITLAACEKEQPEVVERIRAIKTVTVSERGSGQLTRYPGLIEAVDTSILSFEVAGNTREVNVNVGDRVTEGQVLATLDKTPFQLNVEAAEAEVGRAKAVLAEKTTEYDRQNTLYKKEWVSKAAFDQATAARDSAANSLSYANSKLNLARRDLEKTVLLAPFDGVIAAKYADPFQEVARGEKIFDIYIEGAMEVVLSVPETRIGDIYLGLPAEVRFPGERIQPLDGRVSEIGSVASEANAFPVKVILIDVPPSVLPGMTAEASLILGGKDNATSFLVPFSAIAAGDEPGRGYVFVYDSTSSTVRRTPVQGKGVRDNRVMITEGLEAGEIIAVAGVSFLRDGQKVRLMSQ